MWQKIEDTQILTPIVVSLKPYMYNLAKLRKRDAKCSSLKIKIKKFWDSRWWSIVHTSIFPLSVSNSDPPPSIHKMMGALWEPSLTDLLTVDGGVGDWLLKSIICY